MDRVLIAVDGEEQAGPATAYLIERVQDSSALDLLVITVQAPHPHEESPARDEGKRKPQKLRLSVEVARPWLDDAGVHYEFVEETGDLSEVVNRLVKEHNFSEVVLVSQDTRSSQGFLAPLMGRARPSALARLETPDQTRVSVVQAVRPPRSRT
jgi:hypothetical protein